ncbi:MAG: Ig-like domain-containing protein [Bacteroidales bacterium]|nr:Ig-like domain-containing protein [Bacteroidales bacterium]
MKKVLFVLAFCLMAISSYAKLEGDGYYRIKNVGSGRYITVRDNRGSIDIASTSADLGAVELYKGFDNVVSDPSSVLYVQDCGGGFKFYAQGTDTYEIIGYYLKVKLNNDGETYKAYQSNDYLMMYLGDVEMSSVIDGVLGTNAKGTYRDWYVYPVKANSDNYFGIKPEFQTSKGQFASFYASFPFNTVAEGMKVYYIYKVDQGMAVYKEINNQQVPAGMPVLIKCAGANPADNKIDIKANSGKVAGDNQLGGVYFCNTSKAHRNVKAYDANTMRVLGVNAAGELVFKKVSLDYLPANKAYLKVPAGSPDEIKVVSYEEYEANKVVPVSGITLNKTAIELTEGETFQLEASVAPDNATDKTISWSSSDASIASVSNGLVSTLKAGTAVITAKAGHYTATCSIEVKTKIIPVSGITLNKTAIELTEGETFQLEASVAPDNASDKTISWSSSDNKIATVADGLVSTWKAGEVVITAKAGDCTATCSLTVISKATPELPDTTDVPITGIKLDRSEAELSEGESLTLVATITPENATDKSISWSSSDESIATVVNGAVTALKMGEVVITAKAGEFVASCSIRVKAKEIPVESITLDKTEAELTEGESLTLVASILPGNATDKSIVWSSSDERIATVADGVVSTLKAGEAIITAQCGSLSATCRIIVKAKPDALESVEMNAGIRAIYSLQGLKLGYCEDDFDRLPEGLYIINGNKLVKKIAR